MSSNEPWKLTDIASVILTPILLIGYAVYSFRLVRGGWSHLEFLAGEPLVALMIFLGVIAAGLALLFWDVFRTGRRWMDLLLPLVIALVFGLCNLFSLIGVITMDRFAIFEMSYLKWVLWGLPAFGLVVSLTVGQLSQSGLGVKQLALSMIFFAVAMIHCTLVALIAQSV